MKTDGMRGIDENQHVPVIIPLHHFGLSKRIGLKVNFKGTEA